MSSPQRSPRPTSVGHSLQAVVPPGIDVRLVGSESTMVTGITLDSRDVRAGDLFAALPGAHAHGRQFIPEAIERGAVAILTDPAGLADVGILPALVADDPRGVLGAVSAAVYGHPGRDMTLIGVTGTNGKTTVTHLIAAGLRAAGNRVGLIGTAGVAIHDEELPAVRTTPEAPEMHALLAVMRERGITDVVMEVSSHALVLGRVDGLRFDIAGFTHLSEDHLDFHGDMESYFAAKAMLFTSQRTRQAVICVDDEAGRRLDNSVDVPAVSVSMDARRDADVACLELHSDRHGRQVVRLLADGHEHELTVPLAGDFNAANGLLSWAILHQLGVTDRVIQQGVASAQVPGRMEIIDVGQAFTIVVDYAHSPDAVERVLRSLEPEGRRIVVLGCGGDRDRQKRPHMGRIAAEGSDRLFVTDDNPRSEDPADIRREMLAGIDGVEREHVTEVADRRAAIAAALTEAQPGDAVIILGKGHETGQEVAGTIHPFDDRVEVRAVLSREAS